MKNILYFFLITISCLNITKAQTDEDVIRYSNLGVGGSTRFMGISGAMGAMGGDMSCASYNPAGLAMYRRSDLNVSFGLKITSTTSAFNGNNTQQGDATMSLNSFGLLMNWVDKQNKYNRHSFGFTINQLQNFSQTFQIQGRPTPNKSMTLDMLDYTKGVLPQNLDPTYEGAAFNTYLIDTINGHYYSFLDVSKSFMQTKTVSTSGRVNEMSFSYAYTMEDKLYVGASIGIPFIKYGYQSNYSEKDDKDQMYIHYNPADTSFQSSYNYPVYYYQGYGGLSSFSYQSTYTTTATGVNVKLGAIYRPTDYFRFGGYIHSPTWYKAKDIYQYTLVTKWDEGQSATITAPTNGGYYNYTIVTPMKFGVCASGIIDKLIAINADYELINYSTGLLKSGDAGVFDNANKALSEKYKTTGNLRFGAELNTNPVMFRAGWASYGSPFGNQFTGNYVRNSFSLGFGWRGTNFYYDFAIIESFIGKQNYYMYNPKYCDISTLKTNFTQVVFTLGLIGKRSDQNTDDDTYNNQSDNNYKQPNTSDDKPRNTIPY